MGAEGGQGACVGGIEVIVKMQKSRGGWGSSPVRGVESGGVRFGGGQCDCVR